MTADQKSARANYVQTNCPWNGDGYSNNQDPICKNFNNKYEDAGGSINSIKSRLVSYVEQAANNTNNGNPINVRDLNYNGDRATTNGRCLDSGRHVYPYTSDWVCEDYINDTRSGMGPAAYGPSRDALLTGLDLALFSDLGNPSENQNILNLSVQAMVKDAQHLDWKDTGQGRPGTPWDVISLINIAYRMIFAFDLAQDHMKNTNYSGQNDYQYFVKNVFPPMRDLFLEYIENERPSGNDLNNICIRLHAAAVATSIAAGDEITLWRLLYDPNYKFDNGKHAALFAGFIEDAIVAIGGSDWDRDSNGNLNMDFWDNENAIETGMRFGVNQSTVDYTRSNWHKKGNKLSGQTLDAYVLYASAGYSILSTLLTNNGIANPNFSVFPDYSETDYWGSTPLQGFADIFKIMAEQAASPAMSNPTINAEDNIFRTCTDANNGKGCSYDSNVDYSAATQASTLGVMLSSSRAKGLVGNLINQVKSTLREDGNKKYTYDLYLAAKFGIHGYPNFQVEESYSISGQVYDSSGAQVEADIRIETRIPGSDYYVSSPLRSRRSDGQFMIRYVPEGKDGQIYLHFDRTNHLPFLIPLNLKSAETNPFVQSVNRNGVVENEIILKDIYLTQAKSTENCGIVTAKGKTDVFFDPKTELNSVTFQVPSDAKLFSAYVETTDNVRFEILPKQIKAFRLQKNGRTYDLSADLTGIGGTIKRFELLVQLKGNRGQCGDIQSYHPVNE